MVYLVTNTGAQATIFAVGKWIDSSEVLNPLCMTEVQLSSIPNSLTGQKNCDPLYDLEQHIRLGLMAKMKPKTNISPAFGETS